MSESYRGRSRGSESSSGSSSSSRHGQYPPPSSSNYSSAAGAQYSYYPAPSHPGASASLQPSYGYYSNSSPPHEGSTSTHGHNRTSSAVPRHFTQNDSPSPVTGSERASKRQRAGAAPDQGACMQAQWADTQGDPRYSTSGSYSSRGSHHGRNSSASSGYNSPGHSHSHDPYGQQLLQQSFSVPGIGSSTMRDPHLYGTRYARPPSSEYEEEGEEYVDHGPTELPPRTYSGKSKYDSPRKPGKIPGSAMDYLPILEARFDRLETAIDRYVDYRGQRALSNSILPGMDAPEGSSGRECSPSSSRHSRSSVRR